jgi:hypothetical protein
MIPSAPLAADLTAGALPWSVSHNSMEDAAMPGSLVVGTVVTSLLVHPAWAQEPQAARPAGNAPPIERFLLEGRLSEGAAAMEQVLAGKPDDSQARFSLGFTQTLLALEHLVQSLYSHGFGEPLRSLPGGNVVLLRNPNPKPIDYARLRAIVQTFGEKLDIARETLAAMGPDEVKLPLHIGMIRLDMDGDGRGEDDPVLWRWTAVADPFGEPDMDQARVFVIAFDRADAYWLQGYCDLLGAFVDFVMAYDERELFERTAQLYFPKVDTPYAFLSGGPAVFYDLDGVEIMDAIAMIHLIDFPLEQPQRMRSALERLQRMISTSRQCWGALEAETDDDREWIPNPRQASVIGVGEGLRVTPEMSAGWSEFLDEAEAILAGRKLVPLWRGADRTLGVNIHRAFTEPQPFDLVLWLQGSAAKPYIEKGEITSAELWSRLQRAYGGRFFGYAFWFN